jgi:hypothetical protein
MQYEQKPHVEFAEVNLERALAKCLHSAFMGHALQLGLLLVQKTCKSFIPIHHLLPWLGYNHNAVFCQSGKKNKKKMIQQKNCFDEWNFILDNDY